MARSQHPNTRTFKLKLNRLSRILASMIKYEVNYSNFVISKVTFENTDINFLVEHLKVTPDYSCAIRTIVDYNGKNYDFDLIAYLDTMKPPEIKILEGLRTVLTSDRYSIFKKVDPHTSFSDLEKIADKVTVLGQFILSSLERSVPLVNIIEERDKPEDDPPKTKRGRTKTKNVLVDPDIVIETSNYTDNIAKVKERMEEAANSIKEVFNNSNKPKDILNIYDNTDEGMSPPDVDDIIIEEKPIECKPTMGIEDMRKETLTIISRFKDYRKSILLKGDYLHTPAESHGCRDIEASISSNITSNSIKLTMDLYCMRIKSHSPLSLKLVLDNNDVKLSIKRKASIIYKNVTPKKEMVDKDIEDIYAVVKVVTDVLSHISNSSNMKIGMLLDTIRTELDEIDDQATLIEFKTRVNQLLMDLITRL